MSMCTKCGQDVGDSAEYCFSCGAKAEHSPRPAGFWIRVCAFLVDDLIFFPIAVLLPLNFLLFKNIPLLILITLPGLIYKPFMESFYGATLGKMACGIKVTDGNGQKLTLVGAYMRFLPTLASSVTSFTSGLMIFSSPGFESARTMLEIAQLRHGSLMQPIQTVLGLFVLADCIVAAFTYRKRAIHDMLAGSFCVFKSEASANSRAMRMIVPIGRSILAIAAGYAGLFAVLIFPAPIALILGVLGVLDIKKHPEKHGMGRAVFAIIMGALFSAVLAWWLLAVVAGAVAK